MIKIIIDAQLWPEDAKEGDESELTDLELTALPEGDFSFLIKGAEIQVSGYDLLKSCSLLYRLYHSASEEED